MPFWKKKINLKNTPRYDIVLKKRRKEKERRRTASLSRHDQLSDAGADVGPPGCHTVGELNITTEASVAQNQLLHPHTLPPGLRVIDLPPVDISTLISEETLVLTRLCFNVEESLKPLKSVLMELGKLQALVIDFSLYPSFRNLQ
jgi:hypothetical protein